MQTFTLAAFLARHADETAVFDNAVERLPPANPDGPWLAGGALRRVIAGLPLDSDFDFFFASQEQLLAFQAAMKERGAWIKAENEHAITYILPAAPPKEGNGPGLPSLAVQAIRTRWYTSAADVIDSFDYTICQFATDGENLYCGDYALWDLARKRLVPHKITFGASSLRRLIKYAKQGFTVCGGGLAEILNQVVADPTIIRADTQYID